MSGRGVTVTKLTHRSLFVRNELHLGASRRGCHRCSTQLRNREIINQYARRRDRRAALGMSRRALQAVAIAMIPGLLITVVAVVWALIIWGRS